MTVFDKRGYTAGQIVNGTVKVLGPVRGKRQEECLCECTRCGEKYAARYAHLEAGTAHRCSPWKRLGWVSGQIVNGTVKVLGTVKVKGSRQGETCSCECTRCGEKYTAQYGKLGAGKAHKCSWYTDYLGVRCVLTGWSVTGVAWKDGVPSWTLTHDDGRVVCGVPHLEVMGRYMLDLAGLGRQITNAIRDCARYRQYERRALDLIGTNEAEVRAWLPSKAGQGKVLGHIFPLSFAVKAGSYEAVLACSRLSNLWWQDKAENRLLSAAAWLSCPFRIDAAVADIFAKCWSAGRLHGPRKSWSPEGRPVKNVRRRNPAGESCSIDKGLEG